MRRPRENFFYTEIDFSGEGSVKQHNVDTSAHQDIRKKLHEHENKDTIDELSERDGILLFKGREIITGDSNGEDGENGENGGSIGGYFSAERVIETLSRNFVTKQQKDALSGLTDNVQETLNMLKKNTANNLIFKGVFLTYEDILYLEDPKNGWVTLVDSDETNNGTRSLYIYQDSTWIRIVGSGVQFPISANQVEEEADRRFVNDLMHYLLENMGEDPVTSALTYKGIPLTGGGNGGGDGANINDEVASSFTTYSSEKIQKELAKKQDKLSYIPENCDNKDKPGGYAGLGESGKIFVENIPEEALFKCYSVKGPEERNLLKGMQKGSQCYEKMTGKCYVYDGEEWIYLSDSIKASNTTKNNFSATKSPVETDDETAGYAAGSIWINTTTKESFICTDATFYAAKWNLMGGQVNLSVAEVIPFTYDENSPDRVDAQTIFYLPEHNHNESYIELSKNGVELIEKVDYTVKFDTEKSLYYIDLVEGVEVTEVIHGEIYQANAKNVNENMTKSEYDSNHDGKVDRAEVADCVATFRKWEPMTSYKKDDVILVDDAIYIAKENFGSDIEIDMTKWNLVKASPDSLKGFTTSHLEEGDDRRYVSDYQVEQINHIPEIILDNKEIHKKLDTIKDSFPKEVSANNRIIDSSTLRDTISNIKLKDLKDSPSEYINNAFIKINEEGTAIEYVEEPRFPIISITDNNGKSTKNVYDLRLNGFEFSTFNGEQLVLSPSIRSSQLKDMPTIKEHGCVLMSDLTNMRYDLVKINDLTMSQENFVKVINETDWEESSLNNSTRYEYLLFHNLNSNALIISFFNDNNESVLLSYQIIDDFNVKIISNAKENIKAVINCSLGVTNGYWEHQFDLSKFSEIDDRAIVNNRTFSSKKIDFLLEAKADKSLVYTKQESKNMFSSKSFEHAHVNKSVLDKLEENIYGDITFNGKKLLTGINAKTIVMSKTFDGEQQELINMPNLMVEKDINTVLGTELVIQNTSNSPMNLVINDGEIVLINEKMAANSVQKYNLGISLNTSIVASGQGKFNFYISTI